MMHAVVMITFPFANFSSTPNDIAGCEGSCWSEEFSRQTESENVASQLFAMKLTISKTVQ
jgi:hypothetical protein